ncbi:MAG: winged helix-turn-helix transcriptional regulator [Desulfobacterales bacterium]|nr:winged helix-turn-helix transcriptional regulator [Desulfobacterales bacterium]MDP6808711.1 winged helix-turn-helix transcriptional regulator [Desulfobacterales bacterium]
MDIKDLRALRILEEIDKGYTPSQRHLANELNISLGLVNSFIKRLANKGYFKIVNIQRNRVKYLVTPKGVAEKTRLTYEYIKLSYQFYNGARQKLRKLFEKLETEGSNLLVFYGAGDLAEIAYISTQSTAIEMVAVVDGHHKGKKFFDFFILDPEELETLSFDRILVTTTDFVASVHKSILAKGIPENTIILLQ